MSLTTRCPACATMFKVVPDQLRMSLGWVRCGRCGEVFDASANLQPLVVVAPPSIGKVGSGVGAAALSMASVAAPSVDDSASTEAVAATAVATPEDALPWGESASVSPAESLAPQEVQPSPTPPSEVRASDEVLLLAPESMGAPMASVHEHESLRDLLTPEPVGGADTVQEPAVQPSVAEAGSVTSESEALTPREPTLSESTLREPTRIEPVLESAVEAALASGPALEVTPDSEAEPEVPDLPEVSFVRQARRKAFWRRPWVRALLILLVLALALALALQVTIQQRDRLAALEPRLMPWLQALCEPLQCRLAPLRQIESVLIDSSAFTKVDGSVFRLSVSLRNQAKIPVAMPSLELSLTDAQDQPVVRRVLRPADLGARPVLAAAGEWSVATNLTLEAEGQAARIAGYRLIAFYP